MTKKQKREYYIAVIKSNFGWRLKDFKGMTFEEIKAKFVEVWKQVENFIPIGSKEETERLKRKGLNLEKEQEKKQKLSEEAPEIETSTEEFTKEKMKEMMQLVPVEDIIRLGGSSACYQFFIDVLKQLDREDLNQLWALVKEYLSIRPATKWKLYDLSGVHHVTAKEREIFMLVEKDYPLRMGLALVMISYKLQGLTTVPLCLTRLDIVLGDIRYDELTDAKKLCEACDIKATNIVLKGLPPDIYNMVNNHEEVKYICDRVKLLIEGFEISLQERESKMRDEFDMFTSLPRETIHSYYLSSLGGLVKEITDMKEVFNQIETKVAKCSIERKSFEIKEKELLIENDRLLVLIISQDLVHTVVNSVAEIIDYQSMEKSFLDDYSECVKLKADLLKKNEMVEKVIYDELSK
nr:hypothetical protein [Tanacetum cinerariifolium]